MKMRKAFLCAAALAAFTSRAHAEGETQPAHPAAAPAPERTEPNFVAQATAYVYFVPDSPDYVQPTVSFEHRFLHFEARYNYEDLKTGSAWVGAKVSGGDAVWWELTPMLGAVFGSTNGMAPGYKGAVGWWKLELYSEGEYVLDFSSGGDDFFFNWSELTLAPVDWFRFGLMAQRTRVYSTGRELDRGLIAGFSWGLASLTLHLLNPDDSKPIFILALGATFES
jgi:hypothetical protein